MNAKITHAIGWVLLMSGGLFAAPNMRPNTLDIRDFGAAQGAKPAENAAAIQKAIDRAASLGGARVLIPAGEWTSGTIWLKSNVNLHLAKDAVLKASPDNADYNAEDAYPENWGCPKTELWRATHLIICRMAQNVSITGSGTIHGNGDAFFEDKPRFFDWCGPDGWWNGIRRSKDMTILRPGQLVVFVKSQALRVDGITIRNAPSWSLFFHGCSDVVVRNYTVRNGCNDGNTDGVDVDCCQNVLMEDLDIDTGDDAVAIRASGRMLGLNPEPPCENIVVRRAKFSASACIVRIGVGAGLIRNVLVEDVVTKRGGRAVCLNACYGDYAKGGVDIENIVFRRCRFDGCHRLYHIHAAGKYQTFGIRNVVLDEITYPPDATYTLGAEKANPLPQNIFLNGRDISPRSR